MRRGIRLLAAFVLGAIVALPSAALADDPVSIRSVDLADFPLVRLTVSTAEATSYGLADLTVLENGVPVRVLSVEALGGSGPKVDAVLAIDVSNSMAGAELATALAAARTFVEGVPPTLPVGILSFAEAPIVRSPITDDREAVQLAVTSMAATTTQGTVLYDAIAAAASMFPKGDGVQHNLVVLTDGRNTRGTIDLEGAVRAAKAADMTIFAIGLAGPETDEETLRSLATRTGGSYAPITPADLTAVYAGLAQELSGQSVISYRSKAPYSVPVSVSVTLPIGSATTRFLSPSLAAVGVERPAEETSVMTSAGVIGAVVLFTFLAVLNLLILLNRQRERQRRESQLRSRLVAEVGGAEAAAGSGVEPGGAWMPRALVEAAERTAGSTQYGGKLTHRLYQAGWSLHVGEFLFVVVLAAAGGAAVGFLAFGALGALAGVFFGLVTPISLLSRAAAKRIGKIQGQLGDVMMIIASSLRAGHSFLQALDSATKEIGEPAASEFGRTMTEIHFGRDVDESLDSLSERIGSQDLEWAVTAITIQRKIGGNLAEVLETVAKTIRERETLRRQVRVLSAEGRISVAVLTALPVLIGLYLMSVNPEYLRVLTNTRPGVAILLGAGVLMVVGYAWMQRIVKLDV